MATFQFPAVLLLLPPIPCRRPREPPTLLSLAFTSFTLASYLLSLSLSRSSVRRFTLSPRLSRFPVKSCGQLTVRIRTRSACIIYFQRALPSVKRAGWNTGLPAISNSPIGIACHLLCFRSTLPSSLFLHPDEERITIRVLPIYRAVPSPNRCARF